MKSIITSAMLLSLLAAGAHAQTHYKVDQAPASGASSGFVYNQPAPETFSYGGKVLNDYGMGFHNYNDGGGTTLNTYLSGFYGLEFFTYGQRRLSINSGGTVWTYGDMYVNATNAETNPNGSWNSTLSVRNPDGTDGLFSRLSFVNASGGYGAISVKKTGSVSGDMYIQVRRDAGYYITPILIKSDGKVGINTGTPDESLTVRGKIHTAEVRVDTDSDVYPDYVFEEGYQLRSLNELSDFIKEYKHLPEVPTAREAKENGIYLKEMNLLLLKKVEEITLYQIESGKQIELLKKEVAQLKKN